MASGLALSVGAADEYPNDQNRLVLPRFNSPSSDQHNVEPVDPALGTPSRPHFFFAKALHCNGVPHMGCPTCSLCFDRVRPDGRIHRASEQEFLSSLVPGVPVCVVVHGGLVWNAEYARFMRGYQWIRRAAPDYPLHVVFYRWPSSPGPQIILPQLQGEQLAMRAENHGIHLANLLRRLPAENPVSIVAHSLGTRCASSALHLLAGGQIGDIRLRGPVRQRLYRVVFRAASIDHHWLNPNQRYGRALDSTEYFVNLQSRRDWALSLYPFRNGYSRPALGMTGFTPYDQVQLGSAVKKVRQIDVTHIVGIRHSERVYFRHTSISRSVAEYLYFIDPSQTIGERTPLPVIHDSSILSLPKR